MASIYRMGQPRNKKPQFYEKDNSIRQQAKPTANCELRTVSCNNKDNDLDCYLMMNPEKLKQLEEGEEALKEGLGVFGKRVTTTEIASTGPQTTAVGITLVKGEGTEGGAD
ncbi:MAG TPA: hypothetical protein VJK54_08855 [Chthoniobacterales bacterium]|nr:hypothetical protein [Chthoniobacterales bacterium]